MGTVCCSPDLLFDSEMPTCVVLKEFFFQKLANLRTQLEGISCSLHSPCLVS